MDRYLRPGMRPFSEMYVAQTRNVAKMLVEFFLLDFMFGRVKFADFARRLCPSLKGGRSVGYIWAQQRKAEGSLRKP